MFGKSLDSRPWRMATNKALNYRIIATSWWI